MKSKNITTTQYIDIAKIAGLGLGAFFLFKKNGILSSVFGVFKNKTTEQVKEETEKEIENLKKSGVMASYGASQYAIWADQLYNAVITSNPFNPTDEDTIFRIIGLMKNLADVVSLIKAFGVRRLEFSTKSASLGVHLQEDLSKSEMLKINTILEQKNINYKF